MMKLKVNDFIIVKRYGEMVDFVKVIEITDKKAICTNHVNLRVDVEDGKCYMFLGEKHDLANCEFVFLTDEMISELKKQFLINVIKSFEFDKMSDEKLTEIIRFIESKQ